MKALFYKDFIKDEGRYEIDWERNEARYVEPLHGVRIYAHGEVTISRSGYRDPEWRAQLHTLTGLTANMVKDDFYGKQFFAPNGDPVKKAAIIDDILIYDPDRKVAYPTKKWGCKLSFFYPDELARPDGGISVRVPQPALKQRKLDVFKECIELGDTLAAVGYQTGKFRAPRRLAEVSRRILSAGEAPKDLTKKDAQELCFNLSQAKMELNQFMTDITNNVHYYDYLIVEEKEK